MWTRALVVVVVACLSLPAIGRPLGFSDLEGQVFYFVMLDRFADGDPAANVPSAGDRRGDFHGGDLAGLRQKASYISDLGVSAVWVTPVARQVDTVIRGAGFPDTAYHGYWPLDLDGVDPRFGDEAALTAAIEALHVRGVRLVLDVVVNHVGYGSPLAADPARFRSTQTGTCPPPGEATERTQCLFGLPDLRTEDPAVRAFVVDRTAAWVSRYDVDGFRIDALKHVDDALVAELAAASRARYDEKHPKAPLLLVGEHWGVRADGTTELPLVGGDGGRRPLDSLIDFSFDGLVEGFLNGRLRAEALGHHLEKRHRAPGPPLAHFLDSHDTTTLLARLPSATHPRYPLAGVLQMTVRGMPIVTWGDELGRRGGPWPDNRASMDWAALEEPRGRETHRLWRALIHLRRAAPPLTGRGYRTLHAHTDEAGGATLVFERRTGVGRLLVGLRRGPGPGTVTVDVDSARLRPCLEVGGRALAARVAGQGVLEVTLPADGAAIWEVADDAQLEDEPLCPAPLFTDAGS